MLSIYLKPVLPRLVTQAERFLNVSPFQWSDLDRLLDQHAIEPYEHLLTRIDPKRIETLVDANKETLMSAEKPATSETASKTDATATAANSGAATVSIDDFMKIDLRVARIANAEH